MKTKEELFELLSTHKVSEFNEYRQSVTNQQLDLAEMDLRGTELTKIDLSNVDLTGSDLSECDLTDSNFSKSDLTSVNFSGSIIKNADFSFAVLSGSKFNGANVAGSDFAESDLGGTDFSEADLTDAELGYSLNLTESIFNKYTVWPEPENLPDDFDTSFVDDLSSLSDEEDDVYSSDYAY